MGYLSFAMVFAVVFGLVPSFTGFLFVGFGHCDCFYWVSWVEMGFT